MTDPSAGRAPFGARAGTERTRVITLVGLALAPLLVVAVLGWGLFSPVQHLDRVTAAVVNDDTPVTQNGKTIPLGRQFAGSLIAGTSTVSASGSTSPTEAPPSTDSTNFTWVLTNDKDAASGLASGQYAAVLTIPSSFSADATSIGGAAASAKQAKVTVQTSPASALVDPALSAAVTQAATAALDRQLTIQYLQNVYAGFNTIDQQIGSAASGAASLSSGAATLAQGTQSLASGAATLASGTQSLDAGAQSLSAGLDTLSAKTQPLPAQTQQLAAGSAALAGAADQASAGVGSATNQFAQVVAQLCATGPAVLCTRATAALGTLQQANSGVSAFAQGSNAVASGNAALAGAMPAVVGGIDASASGASQVASGAAQTASGAASVSSGAASAATGANQTAQGAAQLASGLAQATQSIPTYSDSDMTTLSAVAAQPVVAVQKAPPTGVGTLPLYAVLALWLGGMATALGRRAVPSRMLLTTTPSAWIALRSSGIVALIGAAQGVVVAGAVQFGLGLRPDVWLGFALAAAFVGAVFGVLNQALAAAFGGVGRLVALVVGIVALTAGLSSTVPAALTSLAASLPTAPALAMLRAAANGDVGGAFGASGPLLVYAVGALALTLAAVAARRSVRVPRVAGGRAVAA
ncbi:YhgE/Pip domain-containing protein [Leifsonia sp. NPDC056665]|uniref:YhgE/Pip domain-containing protein n=1 Tax=Leifsonia sp. NPDC056665 TaxID=3345901 RepID=UPI003674BEAC